MKGIIFLLLISMFCLTSCDSSTDPKFTNSIKVIPLESGYDLSSNIHPYMQKELFNEKDIVYYEWATHTIKLNSTALERIKNEKRELLQHKFVLEVNGHIIYTGTFWSHIFSSLCSGPVINLMQDIQGKYSFMFDECKIENGYHSENTSWDPRSDQRLFLALKGNNLLKE